MIVNKFKQWTSHFKKISKNKEKIFVKFGKYFYKRELLFDDLFDNIINKLTTFKDEVFSIVAENEFITFLSDMFITMQETLDDLVKDLMIFIEEGNQYIARANSFKNYLKDFFKFHHTLDNELTTAKNDIIDEQKKINELKNDYYENYEILINYLDSTKKLDKDRIKNLLKKSNSSISQINNIVTNNKELDWIDYLLDVTKELILNKEVFNKEVDEIVSSMKGKIINSDLLIGYVVDIKKITAEVYKLRNFQSLDISKKLEKTDNKYKDISSFIRDEEIKFNKIDKNFKKKIKKDLLG